MYYQFPLEVLARRRGAGSQLDFARTALDVLLLEPGDVMPEPMPRGLMLYAANEEALARALRVLEETYGSELEIRGPRVRMLPGKPPQEPIMHVRVATHRATMAQVLRELRGRRADIVEECVRDRLAVIRAKAPMSVLVGFPAVLDALTSGRANCAIRLDRYEPVRDASG